MSLHADGEATMRFLRENRNWERWDDQDLGSVCLITERKRLEAVATVRQGRVVSLAKEISWECSPAAPDPPLHHFDARQRGDDVIATSDRFDIESHGFSVTHVDALSHVAHRVDGGWGGHRPSDMYSTTAARRGDIAMWAERLVTRGVLLDIAALRGAPHVTVGDPVTATELARAAETQGVEFIAGDALVVHGGRSVWEADNPQYTKDLPRPGMDWSCLRFLREHDISILCWDFHESFPNGTDLALTMHLAIPYLGVVLVDNCALGTLAAACAEARQWEFLLVVAPLRAPGATGCPVNPLAIL